jgi:chitin disaccharide deacetylase
MPEATRLLAVNGDDFGFTRDVNLGIVEAHRTGILTSTTLMANGAAFGHAVELAGETPSLDIGAHLVLVGGESLARPGLPLPATVAELARRVATRNIDVYLELRLQMERIAGAGIRMTHVDTHKHTHLLPHVLEAVARLAEEFSAGWVRRPLDYPLHGSPAQVPWRVRALSWMLGGLRARFHRRLARHGRRTTDHFAGFQLTGRLTADALAHLIRNLPEGRTELMVHPGHCTEELRAARTRLKESRQAELEALTDARARVALQEAGVELRSFRDL